MATKPIHQQVAETQRQMDKQLSSPQPGTRRKDGSAKKPRRGKE